MSGSWSEFLAAIECFLNCRMLGLLKNVRLFLKLSTALKFHQDFWPLKLNLKRHFLKTANYSWTTLKTKHISSYTEPYSQIIQKPSTRYFEQVTHTVTKTQKSHLENCGLVCTLSRTQISAYKTNKGLSWKVEEKNKKVGKRKQPESVIDSL